MASSGSASHVGRSSAEDRSWFFKVSRWRLSLHWPLGAAQVVSVGLGSSALPQSAEQSRGGELLHSLVCW